MNYYSLFFVGGSWLLGSNPFPFCPMLCLNHAPHKVQDAAMCGFRLAGPEASHHTGWVETPSPRVLAEKQWMKPNASSLPHTFSAQSWAPGSASRSDRGSHVVNYHTLLFFLGSPAVHKQYLCWSPGNKTISKSFWDPWTLLLEIKPFGERKV